MTTQFRWVGTPNMIEFSPLPIDLLLAKQSVAKFRLTHHSQVRARPIIVVRDTPLLTSAYSEKAHLFFDQRLKNKVNGDVMANMPTRMLSTSIRTTSLSGIASRTNFPQPLNRSNQK